MKSKNVTRMLSILLTASFLIGIIMVIPAEAYEPEPARPEISLNEAIALSLKNSKEVRKAELEIDRTETLKEYANDQLDYIPVYATGTALVEIPWANMLAADLTWQMSRRSSDATIDSTALSTCNKYWDVLRAAEKAEVAGLGNTAAKQQLAIAMVSRSQGIIAPFTLEQASLQSVEAAANLAAAENELENAYATLNQAIGLNYWDRPVLTDDEVAFNALKVENLQREISRVKATSPSLWLAQERVTMESYLKDIMLYTGEYRPYQARKIQYEQAELDAMSAEQLYEALVRNLYYGVLSLEEMVQLSQEAELVAKENLRLTQLRYDLGMAIKADVTNAELSWASAKSSYNEAVTQHNYMKLAFEKPWAYLAQ